jgi:hypothetical protein
MVLEWNVQIITFLFTLVATGVGVFLALFFEDKRKMNEEKTHAKSLLRLLRYEIRKNEEHLRELSTELNNQVPFYGLRFVVWNSINPDLTKILKEFGIMKDVADFYFYLSVLQRMLDAYFSSWIIGKNKEKKELAAKMLVRIGWIFQGDETKCKSPQVLISEIDCLIKNY